MPTRLFFRVLPLAATLVLSACGSANPSDENLDALDAELTNSAAARAPGKDPALMSALQSQIMVDPSLAQQANRDAVRPPGQPYAAPIPSEDIAAGENDAAPPAGSLMKTPAPSGDCPQCATAKQAVTLGGLAARQRAAGTANCAGALRYSAAWATRLPAELALYPRARLIEAGGASGAGCALRAASFVTGADLQTVLDWYYTRTTKAGYASEHRADDDGHVLGGTRRRDDAAYVLFVRPRDGGGTEADLIVNHGG